ncbi:hypothetical protein [Alloalcanivorax xenomutans]|uniref:hypothetical protein n=1 Tax=Alloalcanivorax xenomutans TaxID=1094342 RepID=UPI00047D78EF
MSDPITLRFESRLSVPESRIWQWITSVDGIAAELRPWLRMTAPKGIHSLDDVEVRCGTRLFRSYIFLFGVLPIDYSDMTLLALDPGRGFLEQSPMGSMALWRHERRILPCEDDPDSHLLVDQLMFKPRLAAPLTRWFIRRVFTHRHRVLRRRLRTAA